MIVDKIVIRQSLGVSRVAGVRDDQQFAAMAKIIAIKTSPELKGREPKDLTTEIMPNGNVEVTVIKTGKSIGGYIRHISKEVQDERMAQALEGEGDEFESGNKLSYVTHHRRLLLSIAAMMNEDLLAGTLRAKMKKASAICQRVMLLIDTERRGESITREEEQIRLIATQVDNNVRKPDTARLSCEEYFVAAHQALSEATYAGRGEEFSTARFREKMMLASAWCQLAAATDAETILNERLRQNSLWGDEFDQKSTANDWHAYVAHYMSLAMRSSAQDYQINMVKAAGIAQAAILMIDRYGRCAPRHYEGLPRALWM